MANMEQAAPRPPMLESSRRGRTTGVASPMRASTADVGYCVLAISNSTHEDMTNTNLTREDERLTQAIDTLVQEPTMPDPMARAQALLDALYSGEKVEAPAQAIGAD